MPFTTRPAWTSGREIILSSARAYGNCDAVPGKRQSIVVRPVRKDTSGDSGEIIYRRFLISQVVWQLLVFLLIKRYYFIWHFWTTWKEANVGTLPHAFQTAEMISGRNNWQHVCYSRYHNLSFRYAKGKSYHNGVNLSRLRSSHESAAFKCKQNKIVGTAVIIRISRQCARTYCRLKSGRRWRRGRSGRPLHKHAIRVQHTRWN